MKHSKAFFATLALLLFHIAGYDLSAQSPVDYVSPLIGTQSSFELSSGNTYPVIGRPWGMNSWTPMTGKPGDGWQYTYTAHKIRGFKQTHQPSPWINDYGQFFIMPVIAPPAPQEEETEGTDSWYSFFESDRSASWFSHKAESATPYYYSVYLASYDTFVEFAPTERSAIFRIAYPKKRKPNETCWLLLDAFDSGSRIEQIDQYSLRGVSRKNSGGVPENFACHFIVRFSTPMKSLRKIYPNRADHAGVAVEIATPDVEVRIASSFISTEQAEQNLLEVAGKTLEEVRDEGRREWNELLGRVEIESGSTDQLRTFYSALYRSLLFPRRFYETNAKGETVHYSPYNGKTLPGYLYTDTGFWDTFRSLFPLLNLLYPEENIKIQEGLLNSYRESGFFPEWASPGHRDCMIGNNSASVLADAYIKGVRVQDTATLKAGLFHGANAVHPSVSSTGRTGWKEYNELGYVPCDIGIRESAARTLEYAYNDWCLWQLGQTLGWEATLLDTLAQRAMNYKHLFDPETSLMRGRKRDGTFQTPFSPLKWGDAFTEGNAWHYTWSVFHDPKGLASLMGGDKKMSTMLDSVFSTPPIFDESYYGFVIHEIREMQIANMGNYAHGNQPIQHMIYLYNYTGEPWKAQSRLREVMNKLYKPTPDGYCGDEDNGQTSAWYVFSALGFYPVAPGTEQYVLGSPLFPKVTLRLSNGKKLLLEAKGNSPNTPYIYRMSVNGNEWQRNFLTHSQLLQGGKISFEMSNRPNYQRGTTEKDKPYSFSNEYRREKRR
ncbi:MAG: GH92 family glycosyl hydrolase [Porphyromonas sp.]|nr:GH92 family glycosyl hydrolase [Porphyromonas sp.]